MHVWIYLCVPTSVQTRSVNKNHVNQIRDRDRQTQATLMHRTMTLSEASIRLCKKQGIGGMGDGGQSRGGGQAKHCTQKNAHWYLYAWHRQR